ncbi:MAG: hypothetical protein ACI8S6_003219 [Myxococcota bacterium]|jgi:hypothetical protein
MIGAMWWCLTVSALASPVLEVFTNNQPVDGALAAVIEGVEVTLRDDGVAPDRQASDGYWSGALTGPKGLGRMQPLEVRDSGGNTWSGGIEWGEGDSPVGQVGLERDGTLIKPPFPAPAAVPSLREDGVTPSDPGAPPSSGDGSSSSGGSGGLGWLLAALGWGLFIAAALRQVRAEPVALPGTPSALPRGLTRIKADPAAAGRLLVWLTGCHRVLLIGEVGAAIPAGTVFIPRSADLGDVTMLVEALAGRGRPLAVLVVGDARADLLAEGLSDLPVLWAGESGTQVVGDDGAPVPA